MTPDHQRLEPRAASVVAGHSNALLETSVIKTYRSCGGRSHFIFTSFARLFGHRNHDNAWWDARPITKTTAGQMGKPSHGAVLVVPRRCSDYTPG